MSAAVVERVRAHPRGVVVACAALAYANSLRGPFLFDDMAVIVHRATVSSLSAWWRSGIGALRPLLQLTYAFCSSLGLGSFGFHLFNVAVHLATVTLVMALVGLATDPVRRRAYGPVGVPELVAGLLFAVHPIETEAVTYISGRSSSLMTLLYLGAVIVYITGVRARRPLAWALAAPALWFCAMLVKESAATLPLALLLWELCIERPRWRDLALRQGLYWAMAIGALAAAIVHPRYYALLLNVAGSRPLWEAFQYQVHGVAYLLSRFVLLGRLCIDPGLGLAPPAAGLAVVEIAVLIVMIAVAVVLARREPLVAMGVLWFLLHTLVPYTLLSRDDVINERHAYLASSGLFMAASGAWAAVVARARKPVRLAWGGALLVAVLVAFTVARNMDYSSAIALWEQTAIVAPKNPRAYNNLGVSYEAAGRQEEARAAYQRAIAIEPRYVAATRNLARVEVALAKASRRP